MNERRPKTLAFTNIYINFCSRLLCRCDLPGTLCGTQGVRLIAIELHPEACAVCLGCGSGTLSSLALQPA